MGFIGEYLSHLLALSIGQVRHRGEIVHTREVIHHILRIIGVGEIEQVTEGVQQ